MRKVFIRRIFEKKTKSVWEKNGIVKKIMNLVTSISSTLNQTRIGAYAGQTAFFWMLSFVPFAMFCFSLVRMTPLTRGDLEEFVFAWIPADFQVILHDLVMDIYDNSGTGLLSMTVIMAAYLGSKAFFAMVQGLNSMYEAEEKRNILVLRFWSVVYSIIFACALIAVLLVLVFGDRILHYAERYFPVIISPIIWLFDFRILVASSVLFLIFLLFYRGLPDCSYRIRRQIPGTLFATVGWLLFSYFYSIYIEHFSNYATFYGAMTAIALLMVWLYICMYILFLGGIINRVLYKKSD